MAGDIEEADALGGVKFMTREGRILDAGLAQAEGDFPGGLHGIRDEGNAVSGSEGGGGGDGMQHAGFVIRPHEANGGGLPGTDGRGQICQGPVAIDIHREASDLIGAVLL